MLLLLGGYELLFGAVRSRYMPRADSIPILNAMNAQNYLYERANAEVVIVGSSLSGRLRADLLDARTINLAFGGLSALDGLELITRADMRPRLVMIESNVLFRPASDSFLDRLLAPPMAWLRKPLWALRDVARPLTVGLSYAQALARRLLPAPRVANATAGDQPTAGQPTTASDSESLFGRMLDLQRVAYSEPLPAPERTSMLEHLSAHLQDLRARGIEVRFFEMPTHPDLCELPRQRELRSELQKAFATVGYVRVLGCTGIESTDGVHLRSEEAVLVTAELRRLIKQWRAEEPPQASVPERRCESSDIRLCIS